MPNPYYDPEHLGLETVATFECELSYAFDMVIIWRHKDTGNLYWAADSGCSCPTPFDDYQTITELRVNYHDLLNAIDAMGYSEGPIPAQKREWKERARQIYNVRD